MKMINKGTKLRISTEMKHDTDRDDK